MIKNILAVGDSFTYGEELDNLANGWPHLVAASIGAAVNNMGEPGAGNTSIVRKVVNAVLNEAPPDLVVIGWSSPGRIEFSDEDGVFDIWPGYQGRWVHHPWRKEVSVYINKHHNDEHIYKQYLLNIILLQTFLKFHNINYLMTTIVGNEHYKLTFQNKFLELRNAVDAMHFIDPGKGMAEWTYGCKQGPNGHFLDEGHRIVADKVIEKIKQMGWA